MGRILKLLTGALMRCSGESDFFSDYSDSVIQVNFATDDTTEPLGDVENLSSNAAVTLKLAALTAWAQLRISSETQSFLKDVVAPHQALLDKLWIGSLRDYALLRADPESHPSMASIGMDMAQSGLGRETLLPYYKKSAVVLLEALALSMRAESPAILQAFGLQPTTESTSGPAIRPEPLPHFFVVYGLAFEIMSQSFGNPTATKDALAAAKAMQTLVKPIYCGIALFSSAAYEELCTLCYRIALGESALLRAEMVQIMGNFASSRGPSGDQEQIQKAVGIITYTLRASIGSTNEPSNCE